MIYNDVIHSVRKTLNLNDLKLIDVIKLGGGLVSPQEIIAFTRREDDPLFRECPPEVMDQFLNGLIYFKRGKDDSKPAMPPQTPDNNTILKKLRVAFTLKEEDIISILQSVDLKFSKAELTAFFRKEDHPNFRPCGDQLLRNFLKGLSLRK